MKRFIQLGPVPVGGIAPIVEECEKQGWKFVAALYSGIAVAGKIQQHKFQSYFILTSNESEFGVAALPDLKSLGIELNQPQQGAGG
jgi:hypothetical protein